MTVSLLLSNENYFVSVALPYDYDFSFQAISNINKISSSKFNETFSQFEGEKKIQSHKFCYSWHFRQIHYVSLYTKQKQKVNSIFVFQSQSDTFSRTIYQTIVSPQLLNQACFERTYESFCQCWIHYLSRYISFSWQKCH